MNIRNHMTRIITAAGHDPEGRGTGIVEAEGRALVYLHGAIGSVAAVRFGALFAADVLRRIGTTPFDVALSVPDNGHPARTCARRVISAQIARDDATRDALVNAAEAHRYLFRLVVEVAVIAGAAIRRELQIEAGR